jgi:hypothetical protein
MNDDNASRDCLMSLAKRELGAFMKAVTDLYGAAQGEISAADWLDELESMDGLTELTSRTLRQITISAAASLANRQLAIARSSHCWTLGILLNTQRGC